MAFFYESEPLGFDFNLSYEILPSLLPLPPPHTIHIQTHTTRSTAVLHSLPNRPSPRFLLLSSSDWATSWSILSICPSPTEVITSTLQYQPCCHMNDTGAVTRKSTVASLSSDGSRGLSPRLLQASEVLYFWEHWQISLWLFVNLKPNHNNPGFLMLNVLGYRGIRFNHKKVCKTKPTLLSCRNAPTQRFSLCPQKQCDKYALSYTLN